MKTLYNISVLTALGASGLASTGLEAQSQARVFFSEVALLPANPGGTRWIELHNAGDQDADLSGWGIYQTTKTQGLPGIHWWAFPTGTNLAAGAFLRVHWYASYQPSTPTDFYTGVQPTRFLFSLGGEALDERRGALALLSDTSAVGTSLPSSYEDWISWGEDGYPSENLAIDNGRWVGGDYIEAMASPGSIALDFGLKSPEGLPTRASAFFHDASPTPLDFNHRDAQSSDPMGWSCAVGLANPPSLQLLSVPTAGNLDFGVRVRGSSVGFGNQIVMLLASLRPGVGMSLPGIFECPLWVDVSTAPRVFLEPSQGIDTDFDLPLIAAPGGLEITIQALQLREPFSIFDYASSQGLTLRLGY